ncbi:response regulator [Fusibacter bizertensis]|uniref:Stage 0 sporulation protein A homolog n=1 Tax=Fusibacter bizertensis TaxID=1488331 RepID=A0ABT6NGA1_9FIRM|nr:response regulator [Fusibacter bizertensis]MDH8679449.1 response regulator [Fusibacter bizertensis]
MNIIIADDSAFVRSIISRAISTAIPEAKLTFCTNGKEAYDTYTEIKSDWLITDLLMPEMTGQELLLKLDQDGAKVKTIVISADVQKGTKVELEAFGIVKFINKPLTSDKIGELIELLKDENL